MKITVDAQAWTIASLLQWSQDYLSRHGIDEARLTAELLLCHVLGCRRIDLYLKFDMVLNEGELARYKVLFQRRLGHEPLQYIVGETDFMGLALHVDRRALIPRPETESLVEAVIARARGAAAPRILDVGTGSGNIAISLACNLPDARVVAVDVSADALAVAGENCRRHHCDDRVTLVHADVLSVPDESLGPPFAVVVSNPPYVSLAEFSTLEPEVREHEPQMATTDNGDGLTFHRSITDRARAWLAAGGLLALEVGFGQAETVGGLCSAAGYAPVDIIKDMAGIQRIVLAGWRG